jgi:hypothetical protein
MQLPVYLVPLKDCFINLPQNIVQNLFSQNDFDKEISARLIFEIAWTDFGEDGIGTHKLRKAYVAWAGGTSTHNGIEIPIKLANCFKLNQNQMVQLKTIQPAVAKQVQVEPLTPDDWEILSLNQGYLEKQMLHQVIVVFSGQILPLWIHQQTVIQLSVNATDPPQPVVRLAPNSEIIIAPKLRPNETSIHSSLLRENKFISKANKILRILPVQQTEIPATNMTTDSYDYQNQNKYSSYGIVFVNSQAMLSDNRQDGEVLAIHKSDEYLTNHNNKLSQNEIGFVRAFTSANAPNGHIIVNEELKLQLGCKYLTKCCLKFVDYAPTNIKAITLYEIEWQPVSEKNKQSQQQNVAHQQNLNNTIIFNAFQEWLKFNSIIKIGINSDITKVCPIICTNGSIITLSIPSNNVNGSETDHFNSTQSFTRKEFALYFNDTIPEQTSKSKTLQNSQINVQNKSAPDSKEKQYYQLSPDISIVTNTNSDNNAVIISLAKNSITQQHIDDK